MAIQLGGLKAAKPAKKTGGKVYPFLSDPDGSIAVQVDTLIEHTRKVEALEGAIKIIGAELKSAGVHHLFDHYNGRGDVPSTIKVKGGENRAVALSFQNKYGQVPTHDDNGAVHPKVTQLRALLGDKFDEYFKEALTIKIDTTKIPEHQVQPFIDNLSAIAEMCDAIDALQVVQSFKVDGAFHAHRHQFLSAAKNHEVHKALPCVVALKTKGVTT